MELRAGVQDAEMETLSRIVLDHLNLEQEGLLLSLPPAQRDTLESRLKTLAEEALNDLDLTHPERGEALSSIVSLVEAAVEGQGRFLPAAALYALAHDARERADDSRVRFETVVLRYKLAHVLLMADEESPDNIRRCADFTSRTLQQAEKLWRAPSISNDSFYILIFHLQSWLGHRYEDLGLYELASRAYSEASLVARTVDDRVAYTVRLAEAMDQLGKTQQAYELLLLARNDLPQIEDPDVLEMWRFCHGGIHSRLGGPARLPTIPGDSPSLFDEINSVQADSLERNIFLDNHEHAKYRDFLEQALAKTSPTNAYQRHQYILGLILLIARKDPNRVKSLLQEARELEISLEDERSTLDRRVLEGRLQQSQGNFTAAWEIFETLLPTAERIADTSRVLEILGYSLEALAAIAEEQSDVETASKLAGKVQCLFVQTWELQPGTLARRRLREVSQRTIEAALWALLISAHHLGPSTDNGQQLLRQSWNLILRTRNPELQVKALEKEPDRREYIRIAEDAFHRALREVIVQGQEAGGGWGSALERVYELERSSPSHLSRDWDEPQSEFSGPALAFFQFLDLFKSRPLVVLGWKEGGWSVKWIPNGDSLLVTIVRQPRPIAGRELVRSRATEAPGQVLSDFLPANLLQEIARPASSTPWHLFPDNRLSAVSLEMLPESRGGECSFGEDRAVQSCLRSVVPSRIREKVSLSRGWLGLGGVPAVGQMTELPGSLDEVSRIAQIVQKEKRPAEVLTGTEAHANNLAERLESLRPAVLHIACHGQADPETPDACFLFLADCPERPEREILPFRRIADLPLQSVDLVVLSACWSSAGRSSRGAGLEGLAWAFLCAGVPQVLATRYPIDDRDAVSFMETFYRFLETLPAAEALGRTRGECLRRGMEREQVRAWALWC